ncbi:MAG: 3D domain-containing protein [Firmicutes bacterium]|nr:3D domain-containing protein [Alicyclobacillaceae bacterium]MCL6496688.1 3D domain-containing protein [Bacillota bacterium]
MARRSRWTAAWGGLALGAGMLLTVPAPTFAASAPQGGRTLTMVATAYGPSAQDNYPYGATDYFGQPLRAGDVAVDPRVIPLGTCLYITGYHSPNLPAGGFIGEADDEGDAIRGNRVDLFMNTSESQVNAFGIQTVRVTILGKPTNPNASGTAACAGYAGTTGSGLAASGGRTATASAHWARARTGARHRMVRAAWHRMPRRFARWADRRRA